MEMKSADFKFSAWDTENNMTHEFTFSDIRNLGSDTGISRPYIIRNIGRQFRSHVYLDACVITILSPLNTAPDTDVIKAHLRKQSGYDNI